MQLSSLQRCKVKTPSAARQISSHGGIAYFQTRQLHPNIKRAHRILVFFVPLGSSATNVVQQIGNMNRTCEIPPPPKKGDRKYLFQVLLYQTQQRMLNLQRPVRKSQMLKALGTLTVFKFFRHLYLLNEAKIGLEVIFSVSPYTTQILLNFYQILPRMGIRKI